MDGPRSARPSNRTNSWTAISWTSSKGGPAGVLGEIRWKMRETHDLFTISSQVISQRSLKSLGRFRNLPMRYLPPKSMSGVLMHLIFWTGLAVLDRWKNCVVGTTVASQNDPTKFMVSKWHTGHTGCFDLISDPNWNLSYLNYPTAL